MSKEVKDKASIRKRGIKELIAGVAIAAVGAIASIASYESARAGETYTVYTGIIALGVVYGCKGLFDIAFPMGFKKSKDSIETGETKAAAEAEVVKEEE